MLGAPLPDHTATFRFESARERRIGGLSAFQQEPERDHFVHVGIDRSHGRAFGGRLGNGHARVPQADGAGGTDLSVAAVSAGRWWNGYDAPSLEFGRGTPNDPNSPHLWDAARCFRNR